MKFSTDNFPLEEMLDALQQLHPRSDWEEILQQAAIVYGGLALEKSHLHLHLHLHLHYAAEESSQGHCPVCGEDLSYDCDGFILLEDGRTSEDWICPMCCTRGAEYRKTQFDGHVLENISAEGRKLLLEKMKGGNDDV